MKDINSPEIVLVSATDDGYAMPLAVTVKSALERLAGGWRVRLFVLDGGLRPASREMLVNSWRDFPIDVHWLRPKLEELGDLMISEHVNVVTYLRLLMPRLLPEHVQRAIYLDADMLVLRSLSELWQADLREVACRAVQDVAAPYIDSEIALPQIERCRPHLAAVKPIRNYREMGLSPTGAYFNGGLMLADIDHWRRADLSAKMLACLRTHHEHVLWWDQYALNAELAGNWRPLDPRWNQGSHIYCYQDWQQSPFDQATFEQLKNDPWIVHFTSPSKPWHAASTHPYRHEFRRVLRSTAWSDYTLLEVAPAQPQVVELSWWKTKKQGFRTLRRAAKKRFQSLLGLQRKKAA